jgi:hypothetical protein
VVCGSRKKFAVVGGTQVDDQPAEYLDAALRILPGHAYRLVSVEGERIRLADIERAASEDPTARPPEAAAPVLCGTDFVRLFSSLCWC